MKILKCLLMIVTAPVILVSVSYTHLPEVEYHNIVAQPTEHQQEMVKALSERASLVQIGRAHV